MRWHAFLIYTLVISIMVTGYAVAETEEERAAIDSAKAWLMLVDEGRYGRSWDEAAGYFKKMVERSEWIKTIKAVRGPLGEVISRSLRSSTYTTSLPGAPDGEYVVIQFETSFKNKKSAIETVTPMLDSDGHWRVSGYYLR